MPSISDPASAADTARRDIAAAPVAPRGDVAGALHVSRGFKPPVTLDAPGAVDGPAPPDWMGVDMTPFPSDPSGVSATPCRADELRTTSRSPWPSTSDAPWSAEPTMPVFTASFSSVRARPREAAVRCDSVLTRLDALTVQLLPF